jgi:hypothetical protein
MSCHFIIAVATTTDCCSFFLFFYLETKIKTARGHTTSISLLLINYPRPVSYSLKKEKNLVVADPDLIAIS